MPGRKFHFRLEAVLKLRRLEAERAKADLAEAVRRVVAARLELENSQNELDELLTMASTGQAITDLRRFAQARSEALDRTESLRFKVREMEQAEAGAKSVLADRMRDHQALEDLRIRQLEEFKSATAYAEQMALDEFGVTRYGRRQSSTAL